MKAIGVIRVSTDTQQIEDQRDELFKFIKDEGYDEIIPIEAVGASAVKLNDRYMYMVQKIKDTIKNDSDVKAVFVWHMNRLGRNDVVLMEFKEFFIKNRIQFICKNPYLKLLNEDGSVNAGMELAFSLFSTMSKQEVEERKAKFARAKKGKAQKGGYIGGNTIPFGYTIDEQGFYREKPEESSIIRLVFQLYSTGKHSTYTLSKELVERGISLKDYTICKILGNKAYLGEPVGELGVHYPPIVSRELFESVERVRSNNRIDMKRGKRVILGGKLVKCPTCGATCTSNSRHYVCSRHSHHGPCDNGFALRQSVADELLWRVGQTEHLQYLLDISENKTEEYMKQLETIDEKIDAAKEKIDNYANKRERIAENYEDGLINKKTRDLKLSKLEDEVKFQKDYLNQLEEKREAIVMLLENDNPDSVEAFIAALDTMDNEDKSDVVHRHISKLTAKQVSYGKRDPRTHKPNAVEIVVETTRGVSYSYLYFPKFYNGFNLYVRKGKKWIPDMVEITDKKVSQ